MAVILRIDVDSPYGKRNFVNHLSSRLTSDFALPPIKFLPYLKDLNKFIKYLNNSYNRAYFFFRRCTIPDQSTIDNLFEGNHEIGLHLENSRSSDTFNKELIVLENKVNRKIEVFSKHGSGMHKYGLHHYAPYEPEKYLEWCVQLGIKIFFGNNEDPALCSYTYKNKVLFFPAAFWLEPFWRNTSKYNLDWLFRESESKDIVLLMHAENIILDEKLTSDLDRILQNTQTKVL